MSDRIATEDYVDAGIAAIPPGGGAVDSVNGQTGVVVLDAGDVGADVAGDAAAAQAASAPTGRTITAGTGLTGGGDLSANRTLAADFGSGAGKVTQGNDSRLTDSRAPNGAAGGDLSGTYPNPSVVDDSHAHAASTAPGNPTVQEMDGSPLVANVTTIVFEGTTPGSGSPAKLFLLTRYR